MRKKVIVSLCPVMGITIFAIAAWISYLNNTPTAFISMQDIEMKADAVLEETECVSENINTVNENILMDKVMDEPYQKFAYSMEFEDEDAYLLAQLAMAEAEGEDTEGKALVMWVVLNRVYDDEFPGTIREVVYQQGQFSPVSDKDFDKVEPDEDCWKALEMIEADKWNESMRATYFENAGEDAWHKTHLKLLFQHGRHYFYKE